MLGYLQLAGALAVVFWARKSWVCTMLALLPFVLYLPKAAAELRIALSDTNLFTCLDRALVECVYWLQKLKLNWDY